MVERVLENEQIEPLSGTVCTFTVAPDRTSARMTRAGHPPPLLLPADRPAALLPPTALGPPGVPSRRPRRQTEVFLTAGWSLLLYTDGIFEGRTARGDRLGHEELAVLAEEEIARPVTHRRDPRPPDTGAACPFRGGTLRRRA
ncbi:SpoIIE family protein phosphatase [Amycolatopsis sp. NPDC004378]